VISSVPNRDDLPQGDPWLADALELLRATEPRSIVGGPQEGKPQEGNLEGKPISKGEREDVLLLGDSGVPLRERLARIPPAELLDVVVELDGTRELVQGLAGFLGVTGEPGVRFPDVLPHGPRSRLTAQWWLDPRGLHVYNLSDPNEEGRRSYALAQVYASAVAGRILAPRNTALLKWKLRMLHDLGLYVVPAVDPPALAERGDEAELAFATGLAVLFSLQQSFNPGGATSALARTFIADWCGFRLLGFATHDQSKPDVVDNRVRDRVRALITKYSAAGVITKVGTRASSAKHDTQLWGPGKGWR
jgi:hypothetical protein